MDRKDKALGNINVVCASMHCLDLNDQNNNPIFIASFNHKDPIYIEEDFR